MSAFVLALSQCRVDTRAVDTYHLVSLLTCAGHLALAAIAFGRTAARPIGSVLGFLGLVLFAWNAADVAADLSPLPVWNTLDHVCSSVTMPLVLHFLALFLGRGRRWLGAAYLYFASIAIASIAIPGFGGTRGWAVVLLAGVVPTFALGVWNLTLHLRRSTSTIERARTRLVLMAIVFGVLFGVTDLARLLAIDVPRLTNVGTLVSVLLLGIATLRFRLLDSNVSAFHGVLAAALAFASFGTYALVYGSFGSDLGMLAVATGVITFVAVRYARAVAYDHAEDAGRVEYHATLGRFAHQMAHDLRNPIAVAKGAVQFLAQERKEGRTIDSQIGFLTLVEQQLDQMERSLRDYERLGRVEIVRRSIDAVGLVREISDAMRVQAREGVTIDFRSEDDSIDAALDPDLVVPAVENLVRNAIEATDEAQKIVVSVRQDGGHLAIEVVDDGPGMSPRTTARALDDFFTTKASGSGLGLSLARRVATAHGGRVQIVSEEGLGTKVILWLQVK